MKINKNILVLGGDSRQIYMSQYLEEYGAKVTLFGFENLMSEKPFPTLPNVNLATGSLKRKCAGRILWSCPCPLQETA